MTNPVHDDSVSNAEALDLAVAGYNSAGNSGAAITLDLRKGLTQQVVLSASAPTITIGNVPTGARRIRILLKQDATGSRLLPTFSPAVNYGATGAPTLSTAAAKIDVLDLLSTDGGTTLLCTGRSLGF